MHHLKNIFFFSLTFSSYLCSLLVYLQSTWTTKIFLRNFIPSTFHHILFWFLNGIGYFFITTEWLSIVLEAVNSCSYMSISHWRPESYLKLSIFTAEMLWLSSVLQYWRRYSRNAITSFSLYLIIHNSH
jgi:hypothetical protein